MISNFVEESFIDFDRIKYKETGYNNLSQIQILVRFANPNGGSNDKNNADIKENLENLQKRKYQSSHSGMYKLAFVRGPSFDCIR